MMDTRKEKILNIKEPENNSELRKIIVLLSFFRRFIPAFAVKARILLDRLKKDNFAFENDERVSLTQLIGEIVESEAIMLPRIDLPFVIYTDASDFRIGVLVQIIDGEERAITWISRRLHAAEVNYTTTEKECLAVIWAIEKLKI